MSGALVGSLLLLAASFGLLVLAPQLLARFTSASESMPAGGFLPIAAASGIALGGGAAMIAVMARLVRDIEVRPYACLAPVLAVFTGYVMWGLRAKLPLESVSTEYVGVFALAAIVGGGSLVAQRSGRTRGLGWALAWFAPLVLVGLLWAGAGQANLAAVVEALSPQVKMYLGLLSATALAMGLLGEGSRVLARRAESHHMSLPRTQAYGQEQEAPLFEAPAQREYDPPRYEPPPMRFDIKPARVPRVNVWEFEDDELTVPRKGLPWLSILLSFALAGGAGAAFYYGVFLPKQQQERAATQAREEQQQIKAAAEQAPDQKPIVEAQVAAPRPQANVSPATAAKGAAAKGTAPGAPASKSAAPAADKTLSQQPTPTVTSVAPAQGRAPAPVAKRVEAPKPEPARKAAPAQKPANARDVGDEPRNNDPIYGL